MNRIDFLENQSVNHFISWLKSKIDLPDSFHHRYLNRRNNRIWTCNSILDAYQNYVWSFRCTMPDGTEKAGNTYAESCSVLGQLKEILEEAINENNQVLTGRILRSILSWGGVLGSDQRGNLRKLNGIPNLVEYLNGARSILRIEEFDLSQNINLGSLHMSAGFTKIYSMLVENFVIYDGRVGAALGLLVRKFLEENNIPQIPDSLHFSWGAGKETSYVRGAINRRNPSTENYKFKPFSNRKNRHLFDNIKASWLISELANGTRFSSAVPIGPNDTSSRRMEAALFMIGYDVVGAEM